MKFLATLLAVVLTACLISPALADCNVGNRGDVVVRRGGRNVVVVNGNRGRNVRVRNRGRNVRVNRGRNARVIVVN